MSNPTARSFSGATNAEIEAYTRGLANGSMESATPNVIKSLLARIAADAETLDAFRQGLWLILPMAKGYAREHQVGNNAKFIARIESLLSIPVEQVAGALDQEVERVMLAVVGTQIDAIEDALEQAAMLHEQVDCASDAERLAGLPGAGAMGAVVEYRDKIRQLKARLTLPDTA